MERVFILRNHTRLRVVTLVLKQVAVHLSPLGLLRPGRGTKFSVGACEQLFMASPTTLDVNVKAELLPPPPSW